MLRVVPVKKATLSVYDPAMCCATGVCGPAVDPKLIEVANDLRWLAEQGVEVERYNLAQQPEAFVNHSRVNGLLQALTTLRSTDAILRVMNWFMQSSRLSSLMSLLPSQRRIPMETAVIPRVAAVSTPGVLLSRI